MEKSIHTPEYASFLRALRQAREDAGVTQVELAERLDQSQSFVSKVERGESRLDIVQLQVICEALETTLAGFVRRYERQLAKDRL